MFYICPMSGAHSPPIQPTPHPEETRIPLAGLPNIQHVFSVVRMIMLFGAELLQQANRQPTGLDLRRFAAPFGTLDLQQITTRLLNGLRRALALEALLRERAIRRDDLVPLPVRERRARSAVSDGASDGSRCRTAAPEQVRLLTDAEIEAELRDCPIGVVIANICRDFGITAIEFTPQAWQALQDAIAWYGGSLMSLLPAGEQRCLAEGEIYADDPSGPEPLNPFCPIEGRPGARAPAIPLPP